MKRRRTDSPPRSSSVRGCILPAIPFHSAKPSPPSNGPSADLSYATSAENEPGKLFGQVDAVNSTRPFCQEIQVRWVGTRKTANHLVQVLCNSFPPTFDLLFSAPFPCHRLTCGGRIPSLPLLISCRVRSYVPSSVSSNSASACRIRAGMQLQMWVT